MATIRKRGTGWYAQVRRKGYPAEYKTFDTKAEAAAWAREREARIDRQEQPVGTQLSDSTLGDLVKRYRDDVAPGLRGAEPERARLGKMLRAAVCDLTLAKLTPGAFAAYRDDRLSEAAPSTVKLELSLFSRIINLARREWGVPLTENPIERISAPTFVNARDRRLDAAEWVRLRTALAKTRNPLVGPVVGFAIETGMRRGEMLALIWKNVDMRARTARLPVTKNGHPRIVPLSNGAIRILDALSRDDDKVFPMTPLALRLAWVRLTKRAKLDDLHFHDLRHEAISRYAEMGLTGPELALISGHRDPRMLARYTHLRPADLAAKMAGLSCQARVSLT